jgi:hypothetical protein
LEFTAVDSIHFPDGKAANTLRGAFGLALEGEEHGRLFAPKGTLGPSGLVDPPRPFVLRARHLDGVTIAAGEAFHFDLHQLTHAVTAVERAFSEAARRGIGPGRGRAVLRRIEPMPVSIDLSEPAAEVRRLRIEFLSPTELKADGEIVERPRFDVLFARVRDRVSTLRALYGAGALEIDFAGMGARAAAIEMTASELWRAAVERRSSRTGETHSIGGLTGWAEYEGPVAEFLPYLEAGRYTGVGRQAVWGKGEIYTQRIG